MRLRGSFLGPAYPSSPISSSCRPRSSKPQPSLGPLVPSPYWVPRPLARECEVTSQGTEATLLILGKGMGARSLGRAGGACTRGD